MSVPSCGEEGMIFVVCFEASTIIANVLGPVLMDTSTEFDLGLLLWPRRSHIHRQEYLLPTVSILFKPFRRWDGRYGIFKGRKNGKKYTQ